MYIAHVLWFVGQSYRVCCLTPPGQNCSHFTDNILKCIYLNKNFCILIRNSLKFVPRSSVDNKSAWVQVMAWHQTGDKLLPEPMLTQWVGEWLSLTFFLDSGQWGPGWPSSPGHICSPRGRDENEGHLKKQFHFSIKSHHLYVLDCIQQVYLITILICGRMSFFIVFSLVLLLLYSLIIC